MRIGPPAPFATTPSRSLAPTGQTLRRPAAPRLRPRGPPADRTDSPTLASCACASAAFRADMTDFPTPGGPRLRPRGPLPRQGRLSDARPPSPAPPRPLAMTEHAFDARPPTFPGPSPGGTGPGAPPGNPFSTRMNIGLMKFIISLLFKFLIQITRVLCSFLRPGAGPVPAAPGQPPSPPATVAPPRAAPPRWTGRPWPPIVASRPQRKGIRCCASPPGFSPSR